MSEKLFRVQINNKGMPNFSTAEEVEPCKDAISKQWLIDNIEKGEEVYGGVFDTDSDSVKNFINVAPSVTVEPKRGEWIKRTRNTLIAQVNFAYCSECGQPIMHEHTRPLWNFCPNCGADMREEGE